VGATIVRTDPSGNCTSGASHVWSMLTTTYPRLARSSASAVPHVRASPRPGEYTTTGPATGPLRLRDRVRTPAQSLPGGTPSSSRPFAVTAYEVRGRAGQHVRGRCPGCVHAARRGAVHGHHQFARPALPRVGAGRVDEVPFGPADAQRAGPDGQREPGRSGRGQRGGGEQERPAEHVDHAACPGAVRHRGNP